jgi:voltage-gated potassium channel
MQFFQKHIRKLFAGGSVGARVRRALYLAAVLDLFFGSAFFLAERGAQDGLTYSDSVWWAMVTMTTVGYGDFMPETFVGRYLIAYPCFIIGIGLLAYLVGIIAESLIENVSRHRRGLVSSNNTGHVIICNFPGLKRVIQLVRELRADSLYKDAQFVLVDDDLDELPEELVQEQVRFIKGNPTKEDTLRKANILECDGVIILPESPSNGKSDFKTFAVGTIIEMMESKEGHPIKTIAELIEPNNIKMMRKTGVDGIVSPEGIGGRLLVQEYMNPGMATVVEQLITATSGSQFYLYDTKLTGSRVREIQIAVIEHPTNLQIVGIMRNGAPIMNPPKDMKIDSGDQLILLAESREDFDSIEREILEKTSA